MPPDPPRFKATTMSSVPSTPRSCTLGTTLLRVDQEENVFLSLGRNLSVLWSFRIRMPLRIIAAQKTIQWYSRSRVLIVPQKTRASTVTANGTFLELKAFGGLSSAHSAPIFASKYSSYIVFPALQHHLYSVMPDLCDCSTRLRCMIFFVSNHFFSPRRFERAIHILFTM